MEASAPHRPPGRGQLVTDASGHGTMHVWLGRRTPGWRRLDARSGLLAPGLQGAWKRPGPPSGSAGRLAICCSPPASAGPDHKLPGYWSGAPSEVVGVCWADSAAPGTGEVGGGCPVTATWSVSSWPGASAPPWTPDLPGWSNPTMYSSSSWPTGTTTTCG